jgi:hypothetical protein
MSIKEGNDRFLICQDQNLFPVVVLKVINRCFLVTTGERTLHQSFQHGEWVFGGLGATPR